MTAPGSPDVDHLVDVRLVGLPVGTYTKARQHSEELLREFELIAAGLRDHPAASHEIPSRLLALIDELRGAYGTSVAEPETRIEAALANGEDVIDVVFRVPRHAGAAARRLALLFDEADRYCAAGTHLLTLETPDTLRRFRRWYLGEFVRQTGGQPPTPWSEPTG